MFMKEDYHLYTHAARNTVLIMRIAAIARKFKKYNQLLMKMSSNQICELHFNPMYAVRDVCRSGSYRVE